MIKTPVCQIVGYKDSGKTTLMSKLINYYTSCGMRVGALKHHGHGGEPVSQGTDSDRHMKAGALISGVQGDRQLQLAFQSEKPYQLVDILAMYEASEPDLILIEGYKFASFPKIVLLTSTQDEHLLDDVSHPIAIGSQKKELLQNRKLFTIPLMNIEDCLPNVAAYITKQVF